jgi:2-polyprenyl-3-methyl-5-hydroxy-6-metoxy-1,4-benzoquinol methylase
MKGIDYLRFLTKLTAGKIRGQFALGEYYIKRGYHHRKTYNYDNDTPYKDEYQKEVYQLAKSYLTENDYNRVLDIGCGSGFKLMAYFKDYETTGVDVNPTFDYLKKTFPDRTWINAEKDASAIPKECDIIICADVIEHDLKPDELLEMIKKIKFKYLFLSTPERDMLYGLQNYGPPNNPTHVREWNAQEFHRFVGEYFNIVSHQITHVAHTTQLLICTPLEDL